MRDEVLRQRDRLASDLLSREAAVGLSCLMFAFYLPPWQVGVVYAICLLTEVGDYVFYRAFGRRPTPLRYGLVLLNSCIALGAFSSLGVLAWSLDDPYARFVGVVSIVGALLNVSSARSTHLALGVISGLPPSAGLLYIATLDLPAAGSTHGTAVAAIAALAMIGYFGSALVQNHRAQKTLSTEKQRAEEASQTKSRFLSEMSHEMRTPLTAILGLAQTLRDGQTAEVRASAVRIEDAARNLEDLVEEVLDLAASAEGSIRVRPERVVPAEVIEAAARVARRRLRAADVRVSVDPGVPGVVTLDPVVLRKCLAQVAQRALVSSGPGQLVLSLDCSLHPSGTALVIRVSSDTPKPDGGAEPQAGSPIGEELLDRLLPLLGATLDRDGTALVLTVPFEPIADSAVSRPALRALVVDDIATNRFVLLQLLRSIGVEADEADSGLAALAALAQDPYDVVLLDMNMPGMDGEATFRAIRSDRPRAADRTVPVIALTAGAVGEQRERFRSIGIDGFVAKPVDRRLLLAEVEAVLGAGLAAPVSGVRSGRTAP